MKTMLIVLVLIFAIIFPVMAQDGDVEVKSVSDTIPAVPAVIVKASNGDDDGDSVKSSVEKKSINMVMKTVPYTVKKSPINVPLPDVKKVVNVAEKEGTGLGAYGAVIILFIAALVVLFKLGRKEKDTKKD